MDRQGNPSTYQNYIVEAWLNCLIATDIFMDIIYGKRYLDK